MTCLLNIDVPDIDRAVQFYCAAFGLSVGRKFDAGFVELTGGPVLVYLLLNAAGTIPAPGAAVRSYDRHWTPQHLDWVVYAIEPAVARAVQAGARIEDDVTAKPYGKLAVLSDPFGHGFCFIEFNEKGYDVYSSASCISKPK